MALTSCLMWLCAPVLHVLIARDVFADIKRVAKKIQGSLPIVGLLSRLSAPGGGFDEIVSAGRQCDLQCWKRLRPPARHTAPAGLTPAAECSGRHLCWGTYAHTCCGSAGRLKAYFVGAHVHTVALPHPQECSCHFLYIQPGCSSFREACTTQPAHVLSISHTHKQHCPQDAGHHLLWHTACLHAFMPACLAGSLSDAVHVSNICCEPVLSRVLSLSF